MRVRFFKGDARSIERGNGRVFGQIRLFHRAKYLSARNRLSLAYTGGLGGQVCRRTPKSQAVYPFTRFDQVNALAGASEDAPKRDPDNLRSHRGHGIDTWEEVQPT